MFWNKKASFKGFYTLNGVHIRVFFYTESLNARATHFKSLCGYIYVLYHKNKISSLNQRCFKVISCICFLLLILLSKKYYTNKDSYNSKIFHIH